MSTLTIRNLDAALKARLRARAAGRGRSMQAEARDILAAALEAADPSLADNLGEAIRRHFAPFGGVDDLIPHPSELVGEPIELEP